MGHIRDFKGNDIWRMIAVAAVVMAAASIFIAVQSDDLEGAQSGRCGFDLTWELDDDGNLTISGSGGMFEYNNKGGPWGNGIKSVSFEGPITVIGNCAFYSCSSLSSVTLPDSVTAIGDFSFQKCASLAFVDLGDSVKSIGRYAFFGCTSLTSVAIPDSVTSIRECTFAGCTSLASVDFGDSVKYIDYSAFPNCTSLTSVSIPDSVTSISSGVFQNCTSLASVSIPDSVNNIASFAFDGCISLSNVNIPGSLEWMDYQAFRGIRFLDENGIDLLHTAKSLRGFAYEGSSGVLKRMASDSIFVSDGLRFKLEQPGFEVVTLIGYSEPMAHLSVPASVSYGGKDYSVSAIGPKAFYGLSELESVDLGSVSEIGIKAFARCAALTDISFGDSLGEIAPYAFFGCDSLASVTIPDSVASVGKSAFSGCTALTSVTIPGSVTSIGKNAFYGIRFLDERGNTLDISAGSLSGHAYEGRCCVLQRVADGFEFVSGGLVFKVDWSGDSDATLAGFSEPMAHLSVPASVTYEGKEYPVSEIGPKAFYGVGELVSADLGSITEIGMKAFARCSSLESVDFGGSLRSVGGYAFYGCDSLASVVIPDSAVSIGNCAFPFCGSLVKVVIPDSVETIGDRAFYGCGSISSVAIGSSVVSIGPGAFHGLAFFDESGNELPRTAKALAGHLYTGDGDGRLFRSAA